MNPGDIVLGEGNINPNYPKNGHPIVFWSENNSDTFVGLMLTTKSYKGLNSKMNSSHFITHSEDGVEYVFKYQDTHVVPVSLLKKFEWAPFTKIGQLTPEGMTFVESVVVNTEPVYWEEVVNSQG